MDIIDETPHRFDMNIEHSEFEYVSLNSHEYAFDNVKIEKLNRIPNHIRSIHELLSNREKLEYFLTHNAETIIDILKNYELLEENSVSS